MAIKIGGNNVVDNNRRGIFQKVNPGSYNNSNRPSASTGDIIYNTDEKSLQVWDGSKWVNATSSPLEVIVFSPTDGATLIPFNEKIVLTFNDVITKGTGSIRLRIGSAGGSVSQTINVTSDSVTISGSSVTIDPPSDLANGADIYVVVDAGCFINSKGSGNALINTYNFATKYIPALGEYYGGGYVFCKQPRNPYEGTLFIVAPSSTEVVREWKQRNHAVITANNNAGCGDWYVPGCSTLKLGGYKCREYWDSYSPTYWSDTAAGNTWAYVTNFTSGSTYCIRKTISSQVRAFRSQSY